MNKQFGQSIVKQEADALFHLQENFPESFDDVIEKISRLKGKVICTGIGKSSHIARKIAATLASTGTPSFFVHATESMHGDLGMIEPQDAVLALSHSGETQEVIDMIKHSQSTTHIAMTARSHSALARLSDSVLTIPDLPEACPLGVAPSNSTTMMLALGDALALTLSHKKNFQKEGFARFHPGGSLGKNLATMHRVMKSQIPLSHVHNSADVILSDMVQKGMGFVILQDNQGKILGLLKADHVSALVRGEDPKKIADTNILKARPGARVQEVKERMKKAQQSIVLIEDKDDGSLRGFWIHSHSAELQSG